MNKTKIYILIAASALVLLSVVFAGVALFTHGKNDIGSVDTSDISGPAASESVPPEESVTDTDTSISETTQTGTESTDTDATETASTETDTTVPETTTDAETTATAPDTDSKPPVVDPVVMPWAGGMPVISIITGGAEILSRTEYVACTVSIRNGDNGDLTETAGIRVRGNSSAFYGNVDKIRANKVPYKLKFDTKTDLLGLNDGHSFRDWVLLRSDNGGGSIGNDVGLRLGRAILGADQFCGDAMLVRLYVNGRDLGVYLLTEQCEVKKNRVNINEPDKGVTDLNVGYYLEIENYTKGETVFTVDYCGATVTDIEGTKRAFRKVHYSVKSDINTDEQLAFIKKYVNNVFRIVYEACEKNNFLAFDENYDLVAGNFATSEETVEAVFNIDAGVNMYILYELLHDFDVGAGSFYMAVDFSPASTLDRLTFTSPWDLDWICGGSYENKYWAAAFCDTSFSEKYGERSNPWFILLGKQDWFIRRVKARWTELSRSGAISGALDEETAIVNAYSRTDFDDTYTAKRIIKWITNRAAWLDKVWGR